MWRVQNDSQIADWQMQVISALTNMLEEVCCSSRLAYKKKKKKKKKIMFIYVCTNLENTIQNTTTCLNQLCQCCGYESCFVEKLTMTHFQVLKVRTHMSGSETNLNPVKDPLVVSLVLDQSVQLSGQICSAELLLLVLLRLIAQCKLHILQREREGHHGHFSRRLSHHMLWEYFFLLSCITLNVMRGL